MMSAAAVSEDNIWAGYRKNRCDWLPEDLKEEHGQQHHAKNVYVTKVD